MSSDPKAFFSTASGCITVVAGLATIIGVVFTVLYPLGLLPIQPSASPTTVAALATSSPIPSPGLPTPTQAPAIQSPAGPTETARPSQTPVVITVTVAGPNPGPAIATPTVPTPTAAVASAATPTVNVAPGVYGSSVRVDPAQPRRGQPLTFNVSFLNTTSRVQHYRWLVKVFEPGKRTSIGETAVVDSDLPIGASEIASPNNWKLGTGGDCAQLVARVFFLDQDKNNIELSKPDKSGPTSLGFQICP